MEKLKLEEVFETVNMFEEDNLDVRTITMGISLLDCISDDVDKLCENIYNKIYKYAKDLYKVGEDIYKEYRIPIVNKRISVTPISIITASSVKSDEDFLKVAKTLDKVAKDLNVNFIGGYSAIVKEGMTPHEERFIKSIPYVLSNTERICSSIELGSTRTGLNMDAVKLMGKIIKELSYNTKDNDSIGCVKLVVFANAPDDNPFMAGAFHGVGMGDVVLNVGVSGPGVVRKALSEKKIDDFNELCETIKKIAFKITRVGQLVGTVASERLNVPFGIIDLSLAPTIARGDSIAEVIEAMGIEKVGAPGTTAALALLNDNIKKGGMMAARNVGGLSGAFIPVSEDAGMIKAVLDNSLNIEKLEAMTSVCSVGLDMIAIPGDTSEDIISGIIADEMMIGVINQKTTAVRIIPAYGKKEGEMVHYGGLLGEAPIMKINKYGAEKFIERKGFIPAPLHSFKN